MIIYFLKKHFNDPDGLVRPKNEIELTENTRLMDIILNENDVKKDYRLLKDAVRKMGTNIPPLVNSYINSSSSMRMLGSCINDELGDAIETGIMLGFDDMYAEKRERHTEAYIMNKLKALRKRYPNLSQSAETKLREHIEKKRKKNMAKFQRRMTKRQSPNVEFI